MVTSSAARGVTIPTIARTAPAAALVAAAGFIAEAVITLIHHTGDHHWDFLSQVLNAAYALACVALVIALPAIGRWLQVSRLGRAGVIAAQIGFAAMAVESIASGVNDGNTLGPVFFLGLLLTLLGQLVLGIAALISGRARWAAMLPFIGLLVGIIGGDHGGSVVLGVVWIVLGVALSQSA